MTKLKKHQENFLLLLPPKFQTTLFSNEQLYLEQGQKKCQNSALFKKIEKTIFLVDIRYGIAIELPLHMTHLS